MIGRLRHILSFTAVVVLLGLSASARAACPALPNLPPLEINVQLLHPEIVYHHDIDLFGLPTIQHGAEHPPPGATLFGLTKLVDSFRAGFQTVTLPVVGEHFCVWLEKVDAVLGDKVMDVYIAADYPPDSCEYKVTLAHENTHVRFNLEALRDWLPKIKAALTEGAKKNFPASFPVSPTKEELDHVLLDSVAPVFAQLNQDMAKRNGSIDTQESYRREIAKCDNWMRKK